MNWVLILVSALAVLFLGFAIFVSRELLKKFKIYEQFISTDGYHHKEYFYWEGSKRGKMRKIIIEGTSPFQVLAEFKFPFGGIDFFGTGESHRVGEYYYVCISTFLWRPIELIFEINSLCHNNKMTVRRATNDFPPDIICNPHFIQRIGLWS